MADLGSVKNVIIPLLNLYPQGISYFQLSKDFKQYEGYDIPYEYFGYHSAETFMESVLNGKGFVVKNGLDVMIYPKNVNGKSAHIATMIKEQVPPKTRAKRGNNIQNSGYEEKTVQIENECQASRRMEEKSPNMPNLVPYNSNKWTGTTNRVSTCHPRNIQRQLLKQSQQAYLATQNKIIVENASLESNKRKPLIRELVQKLEKQIMTRYNCENKMEVSQYQMEKPAPEQVRERTSQIFSPKIEAVKSSESSIDGDYWDDDLDEMEPPLRSKNENSFYGVSDSDSNSSSIRSPSNHDLICEKVKDEMFKASWQKTNKKNSKQLMNLTEEICVGDVLLVEVFHVNDPLNFWIKILSEKYVDLQNDLWDQMQEFYQRNRNSEELKVYDPDESKCYAAYYDQNWHRVELCDDLRMGESIRVLFVDFGTRDFINISQMRKLDKQFFNIPRLAMACALGDIRPSGTTFTALSLDYFIELVEDRKMFARVLSIDESKPMAIIELILEKKKKSVSQELIRMGHAVFEQTKAREF